MLLLLDNRDSFTFNLEEVLCSLGAEVLTRRSTELDLEEVRTLAPGAVLVGPGPGGPEEAGCSVEVLRRLEGVPVLGVCLGHQALAVAFGGRVSPTPDLVHGELRPVRHDGRGVFRGLPDPVPFTRYNSLGVEEASLPAELEVSARQEGSGAILGLRHRSRPLESVQFHPESFLCVEPHGRQLLASFLDSAGLLPGG